MLAENNLQNYLLALETFLIVHHPLQVSDIIENDPIMLSVHKVSQAGWPNLRRQDPYPELQRVPEKGHQPIGFADV